MKSFSELFNRIRKLSHSPHNMLLLLVLVIMAISTIYIYITVYSNEKNREVFEVFKSQEAEREWDIVEQIILQNDTLARTTTRVSALELEQQLKESYPDLDQLKLEFDNGTLTGKFHSILTNQFDVSKVTNKAYPYLTVIGTREHMLGTFGSTSDSIINGLDLKTEVSSWEEVYNQTVSPDVSEKSFSRVMKLSKDISFIQTSPLKNGDVIKEPSIAELRRIYTEHGIKGLNSITLLSPAYITETGDIFGSRDMYFMQKNKTHKIIIIQFINLGDLLTSNKDIIKESNDRYEYMEKFMIMDNANRVLFALIWAFIMFIVSVGLIMIYNIEGRKIRSMRECNNKNIKN